MTISNALKSIKPSQQRFPRERNRDQGDELSGDFVDHDELGIFPAGGPGDPGGGGDADQDDEYGERDRLPGRAGTGGSA